MTDFLGSCEFALKVVPVLRADRFSQVVMLYFSSSIQITVKFFSYHRSTALGSALCFREHLDLPSRMVSFAKEMLQLILKVASPRLPQATTAPALL